MGREKMDKPFLQVARPEDVQGLLRRFGSLEREDISIADAAFRVVAESVRAEEDIPGFDRSTMDGFAVHASDTFGATESAPALLEVAGEVVMGELPGFELVQGTALRIWTGGALPAGSDAVVMVEQTQELDRRTVEVFKAVAPFENVVRKGEDFQAGEILLRAGHRLRPQDLGLLAAMGRQSIEVYRKPSVAIISSGDEIVPIDQTPPPGCMRDVNRYTLSAMVQEARAQPVWIGIAGDSLKLVSSLIAQGLQAADTVVISGGSSMGSRDLVIEALAGFDDSEILVHGVSISPGKPLILARVGSQAVFGLPGHPISAMVCFEHFVVPLLRGLEGEDALRPFRRTTIHAFLSRNVPSREGRTDYVRVRLESAGDRIVAVPLFGKSGMISSMVRAHGFVRIDADCEGLYRGDQVTVHLFSDWTGDRLEKEHLSGHEAAGGGAGDLFETPQQELLSRV